MCNTALSRVNLAPGKSKQTAHTIGRSICSHEQGTILLFLYRKLPRNMTSTSMKKSIAYGRHATQRGSILFVIQVMTLAMAGCWLLAVTKVFLLEDGTRYVHSGSVNDGTTRLAHAGSSNASSEERKPNFQVTRRLYKSRLDQDREGHDTQGLKLEISAPRSSEWLLMRSHQGGNTYKWGSSSSSSFGAATISSGASSGGDGPHSDHQHAQAGLHADAEVDRKKWVPSTKLPWPPVQDDFTIKPDEGFDEMPVTKMKVPRFWYPQEGANWNTIGSKTTAPATSDGEDETIFLMIASYRDFQCRETITSAFKKADHPERLYVGAVDQIVPGDIGCLDLAIPCEQDPTQMICVHRSQISVYKMDASMATGPVTARHIGDRMYRGQYYVMQMDAHCLFVRHWDSFIIRQFKSTGNEMAVLTSYLTDIQGSLDANGDSTRNTRPIMCNSFFEGVMPARYLRHGSQPEDVPTIHSMPQLQPFWAAGFSFSRGHFKLRVPYDSYQPMVFQGEEIAIGLRAFTHGYDFYAPRDSVVFHEYAERSTRRKKIHMFWENTGHRGEGQRSLRRATSVIGMAPDVDPSTWDHSEIDKYGLGKVRPLDLFYRIFAIDVKERTALQLCPFVKTGVMHNQFQRHLRPNGLGIDYTNLMNFEIRKYLPGGGVDASRGQKRG